MKKKKYPDEKNKWGGHVERCQNCGSYPKDHEARNVYHSDGDVYCCLCGEYVRMFDAA